jgi:alkylhydroperoxidase family enzyme
MTSFLGEPQATEGARRLYDEDLRDDGYVMNLTTVWAHAPDLQQGVGGLLGRAADLAGLTFRQRAVLVSAAASTFGDSYCALAWGTRLAGEVGAEAAADVLSGIDAGLDPADAVLARWARQLAADPNATTPADVEALRSIGLDDGQIVAVTVFVAVRMAFSTVNDALGAHPDAELATAAPAPVRAAITFGRPAGTRH